MFQKSVKKKMLHQIKINKTLFRIFTSIVSKNVVYEAGFLEIPIVFTYSCCHKDLDIAYSINIHNIEILICYCIDEIENFKNTYLFRYLIGLKKLAEYYV